jgi:hypothetical protein
MAEVVAKGRYTIQLSTIFIENCSIRNWPAINLAYFRAWYVGQVSKGVGDLIINNASDRMSVWGLASDGNAAVWQIDDGILRQ